MPEVVVVAWIASCRAKSVDCGGLLSDLAIDDCSVAGGLLERIRTVFGR